MVEHALQCKRGGIVTFHHNNVADEWGTLYVAALIPWAISHKPLINYGGQQTVTGGETTEMENEELDRQ